MGIVNVLVLFTIICVTCIALRMLIDMHCVAYVNR